MQSNLQEMNEKDIIRKAQEGEGDATTFLLEKYKGSVRALSRPLFLIDGDQDDLLQEGMIGLFKAIQNYDTGKGVAFEKFANLCISRQLYSAIEKSNRKKNIPLNSYISIYSSEYSAAEDTFIIDKFSANLQKNPEEIIIKKESAENILQNLTDRLSKMEKKVLKLFLEGLTYREIAMRLGLAPKTIDNALQRIKVKLKNYLQ